MSAKIRMPAEWKEKQHPDGAITWILDIPLRPGLQRPTACFSPGRKVIACSAFGYFREFDCVQTAKEWAAGKDSA
jgi:hypothetical protein